MVSFYTTEDPTSIMNKKTDDIGCQSDDVIPHVPKSVLVGISHGHHPDNDSPMMTREDVLSVVGSPDDWVAVNTPSSTPAQSDPQKSRRKTLQRQLRAPADVLATSAERTEDPTERKIRHYEALIERLTAARDYATSRYQKAEAAACTENERFQEQMGFANRAAESARAKADQEMALLKEQSLQVYEMMQSDRDQALQDLSEARAQLAAIEMQGHDRASCQKCHALMDKLHRTRTELETELDDVSRELETTMGLVDSNENELIAAEETINKQGTQNTEQRAEIDRLNSKLAELHAVSERLPDNAGDKEATIEELIEHTDAAKQFTSGHPLVMRIDVWVGGEHGTDTELALVKMNPDTPFKVVLEDLRHHNPLMALKQKDTGRYIFESDTPAHLGVKDGEEFVFIQQNDEPNFMLDATMEGVKCWRGKDSRV